MATQLTDNVEENDNSEDQFAQATNSNATEKGLEKPICTSRKRRKCNQEDPRIAAAFNILTSSQERRLNQKVSDRFSTYGEHVANKLRTYSTRSQAVAEHKINNILFEADMGLYDHDVTADSHFSVNCGSRPASSHSTTVFSPVTSPLQYSSTSVSTSIEDTTIMATNFSGNNFLTEALSTQDQFGN